jgi:ATP-dependent helicase/nuclease subunit A
LLAGVAWLHGEAPDAAQATWAARGEAGRLARACLQAPALAEVWQERAQARLWRERAFEVVLDGMWLSGVFDRVVIDTTPTGTPVSARVYDFKTDESVRGAGERHARQMNFYRLAAAQLLGLPRTAVTCRLVLVRTQECIEIPLPPDGG